MTSLNQSATQQFDYCWHPLKRVAKQRIPKALWPWLAQTASLTHCLRQAGHLEVQVLEDCWGKATHREQRRLGLHPREAVRVRTVLLHVDGIPVVYGRSIIPARSLRGHWRFLTHLGSKPLGGYLYRQTRQTRSRIEITRLPAGILSHRTEALWARRSVFYGYGPGVLVNEAFFPEIDTLQPPKLTYE
ncbi:chorismate lyase [Maribrevibacterium harenarium]|uniref:Probable chorismate pyruvate-lyase n=1 Tax=Maribrevibacterium harenarium TaxID=2589817 RepID=A0A501WXK3_9GAMM|nr:chorismate lyase [Maribrevibacterium harenarium]TPE53452.1 chorismate lyase [Maribrevibacterium harenarium]